MWTLTIFYILVTFGSRFRALPLLPPKKMIGLVWENAHHLARKMQWPLFTAPAGLQTGKRSFFRKKSGHYLERGMVGGQQKYKRWANITEIVTESQACSFCKQEFKIFFSGKERTMVPIHYGFSSIHRIIKRLNSCSPYLNRSWTEFS